MHPASVVAPNARLAVTWIGHATTLIQLDDKFVLTDPVFTDYVGGVSRRLVEPGLRIAELPPLSAVVVSHRHFDHLSTDSLAALAGKASTLVVPEGARDDIPDGPYAVTELAWWGQTVADGVTITSVPVQHVGARTLDGESHPRSFTGYVIEYHGQSVYFGGDTAYAPDVFRKAAERFPHLDLALLPIGPIAPRDFMRKTHMDPREALMAAGTLHPDAMIPIHFDTFINSYDDVGDCERALREAMSGAAPPFPPSRVTVLRIGEQRVVLGANAPTGS